MRESKSKNRKTGDNSDGNEREPSLLMELDLIAVRAKNADLIKGRTKLLQENSELRNEIYSLHSELLDAKTKCTNLESALRNLEQNMKKCTPNLIDILNLFLKVSNNNRTSYNILNMTGSDTGFTPKNKAITNTVKPHTVNGTVLNLVPTISLTRLTATSTNQRSPDVSSTSPQIDYRNSLPSTSSANVVNQNGNLSPNLDVSEAENQSFVSRRRHTNLVSETRLNGSVDLPDDIEPEQPSSDESEQEEADNREPLSTIQEESMCSTGRGRTSLGEVRIYLSRLSAEDMHVRHSHNNSFSSTEANVNDTCLNIETTVIDNQENRGSKRLRADIMVFSPATNSTRMESDTSVFDGPSPRDDKRKISGPSVSAIQSNEITPSRTSETEEQMPSERFTWLPTPSLSAMGDIDANNTNLEILTEMMLMPDSLYRSENNTHPVKHSPPRNTRSSDRIQIKSKSTNDDESPRTSITTRNRTRSVKSFVSRCKSDNSNDRALTPTIVLERLETASPHPGHTATSLNIQIVTQSDEPKENESPPKKRQKKSKKGKAKSKTPKKSVKRKLNDDEEKDTEVLQEKIREIQIRLSNYIPETPETAAETPEISSGRPKRAARPTSLKDASLKGKMRRMF